MKNSSKERWINNNLCLSIAFINSRSGVGGQIGVVKQQESVKNNEKRELDKRKWWQKKVGRTMQRESLTKAFQGVAEQWTLHVEQQGVSVKLVHIDLIFVYQKSWSSRYMFCLLARSRDLLFLSWCWCWQKDTYHIWYRAPTVTVNNFIDDDIWERATKANHQS